jgi:hypothetical protein
VRSKEDEGACLVGDDMYRWEGAFAVSTLDVRETVRAHVPMAAVDERVRARDGRLRLTLERCTCGKTNYVIGVQLTPKLIAVVLLLLSSPCAAIMRTSPAV